MALLTMAQFKRMQRRLSDDAIQALSTCGVINDGVPARQRRKLAAIQADGLTVKEREPVFRGEEVKVCEGEGSYVLVGNFEQAGEKKKNTRKQRKRA